MAFSCTYMGDELYVIYIYIVKPYMYMFYEILVMGCWCPWLPFVMPYCYCVVIVVRLCCPLLLLCCPAFLFLFLHNIWLMSYMRCCDYTISDVNEYRHKQPVITNGENMSSELAVSLNSFSLLRLSDFYVLSPLLRLTSTTKYSLMLILKGSYLNSPISYAKPQLQLQK